MWASRQRKIVLWGSFIPESIWCSNCGVARLLLLKRRVAALQPEPVARKGRNTDGDAWPVSLSRVENLERASTENSMNTMVGAKNWAGKMRIRAITNILSYHAVIFHIDVTLKIAKIESSIFLYC